ncbi:hypothetical protein [Nocardia wallacei]|uniref:hypothetical protein n=1 Tax=Nocardia wallacei TaxID=480035 RepID=UPI0024539AE1|nr:hypothetical protein [Nocardia wallacei]
MRSMPPSTKESRYTEQLQTVRRFAVTGECECVDLGGGYCAFWARLPNGYDIAVSNNEMDGVLGRSDRFTVCVYLDGEFIANLVDGTLDELLRRATDGAFDAKNSPTTPAHRNAGASVVARQRRPVVHPVGHDIVWSTRPRITSRADAVTTKSLTTANPRSTTIWCTALVWDRAGQLSMEISMRTCWIARPTGTPCFRRPDFHVL